MDTTRHSVRGLFGGLFLGVGLVLMLFVYGVLTVNAYTWLGFAVGGAVLGWLTARFVPPRTARLT